MKRTIKDYLLLALKGVGMGAADVIPGVSGGTIAFIVGIYEELLNSIKNINGRTLKLFFTFQWRNFWREINGNFLLVLVTGIGISLLSLAKLMIYFLENHPVLVCAFFFGLILVSIYYVSKQIKRWSFVKIVSFLLSGVLAYFVTTATPTETTDSLFFIFLCGAIAICAMILPGISGSFILVLLGKYYYMMTALTTFDFTVILTFVAGAAIGIVMFSKFLSWLLKRFHDLTIAILAGFMLGSLNKVWPWKLLPPNPDLDLLGGKNTSIGNYAEQFGNSQLVEAIGFFVLGIVIVLGIEMLAVKMNKAKQIQS